MGPVRRVSVIADNAQRWAQALRGPAQCLGGGRFRALRLALLGMLTPSLAAAQTCGTPATQITETVGLFLSPVGLFLVAALAVALIARHTMGVALVALLWSFFISALVMPGVIPGRTEALATGCAAPATLFIALSTAICGAAVFYTFRREKRL